MRLSERDEGGGYLGWRAAIFGEDDRPELESKEVETLRLET